MRGKADPEGLAESSITLVETLPPEWNTKSKQKRVVESGGANEFDFNIKGK
jgi:hypothetical protein